jgi:translation initiation factor IF-2
MGHIDHGKSTLLDYIRKSNIVAGESGGITQHISAYEIEYLTSEKIKKQITFLDTPGHAAFTCMRECGASAADIAILVVSAEDGVKTQTLEALRTIVDAAIPYIVAINKIDRPNANIEKTKLSLSEHGILVEGYGGTIPWVPISAKIGTGVDELLETILLVAEMEDFRTDTHGPVEGILIESNHDPKRGITGTIIIKEGILKKGHYVVCGGAYTTTRIMEDYTGKQIAQALAGTPIALVGFDTLPRTGGAIVVFETKKEAEKYLAEQAPLQKNEEDHQIDPNAKVFPLIIKTDVFGTAEAIEKEIRKIAIPDIYLKIIQKGTGNIAEGDVKLALSDKETVIIGFNVGADTQARDLAEQHSITLHTFTVIYKLTEWLEIEAEKRRPRKEVREVSGRARVLKVFSHVKDTQVIGALIEDGSIKEGSHFTLMRKDVPLAEGKINSLQQAKQQVKEVLTDDFGAMITLSVSASGGDVIEAYNLVIK